MDWIDWVIDDAMGKWREGIGPFLQSPYGIILMFVALFLFLNSGRRRR